MALRLEEGEAHASADDERVDDLQQRLDDAQLVADLRAAEDGHERTLRLRPQSRQHLDFFRQQTPGGRGKELRRADDRRVRAVRRAERVVYIEVEALDQI